MTPPDTSERRINAMHHWYCDNVLPVRLTPEVQRLWFEWLKAGYTGPDLRDVVRYIRKQISLGKRNEGALKLSNLFERSEGNGTGTAGFLKFDEDLGLARAQRAGTLSVNRKLAPTPDEVIADGHKATTQHRGTESTEKPQPLSAQPKPDFDGLRKQLRGGV